VKFEKLDGKYSTLQKEAKVMLMLKDGHGFPKARLYRSTEKMDILAMDRLGPNLERLLRACQGRFSLKTTLLIGE
jgi:predicted Ser/Thr protein kinase